MIGFPTDPEQMYGLMRRELLRDRESKESFTMPAEYMFHDLPQHQIEETADPVSFTLSAMDRCGVETGLVSLERVPGVHRAGTDRTPRPLRGVPHAQSERRHGRHTGAHADLRTVGDQGGLALPPRCGAAGGHRRTPDVSDLCQVRGVATPRLHHRRYRRATRSLGCAEGGAPRPGALRLPRVGRRHAARARNRGSILR